MLHTAARRVRPAAAALVLAVAALVAAAAPVAAHARLESSDPAGGSTVATPPTQLTLTFNEEIETDFSQLQVVDPAGARVDAGVPTVSGMVATVPLRPGGAGAHQVAFRVVSADGHPIEATFSYDVAAPAPVASLSESPPGASSTEDSGPSEPALPPSAAGDERTATEELPASDSTAAPTENGPDERPSAGAVDGPGTPQPEASTEGELDALATAAATGSSGGTGGLLVAGAAAVLLLGAVYVLVRRRSARAPAVGEQR